MDPSIFSHYIHSVLELLYYLSHRHSSSSSSSSSKGTQNRVSLTKYQKKFGEREREMRKYKYKILDMIPNAWFHKIKEMTKPKPKPKTKPSSSSSNTCVKKKPFLDSLPHHSSTSYFSNNLIAKTPYHNSPRNSFHMSKRKTLYKPSLKPLTSTCHNKNKITNQDSSDFLYPSLESYPQSLVYNFYEEDYDDDSIDLSNFKINTKTTKNNVKEFAPIEKACLTSNFMNKPRKDSLCVMISKEIEEEECECKAKKKYKKQVSSGRKSSSSGINLKRVNSPRIQLSRSSERKQAVLESFAVIKSSIDPKKDFRESMVEMIEENKISDSKGLEDLLACYLTLNPKEYHDLIIQVFEQIWHQLEKDK